MLQAHLKPNADAEMVLDNRSYCSSLLLLTDEMWFYLLSLSLDFLFLCVTEVLKVTSG